MDVPSNQESGELSILFSFCLTQYTCRNGHSEKDALCVPDSPKEKIQMIRFSSDFP